MTDERDIIAMAHNYADRLKRETVFRMPPPAKPAPPKPLSAFTETHKRSEKVTTVTIEFERMPVLPSERRYVMNRPDRKLLEKLPKKALIDIIFKYVDGFEILYDKLNKAGNDTSYSDNRYVEQRYDGDIGEAMEMLTEWVEATDINVEHYLENSEFDKNWCWNW